MEKMYELDKRGFAYSIWSENRLTIAKDKVRRWFFKMTIYISETQLKGKSYKYQIHIQRNSPRFLWHVSSNTAQAKSMCDL